MDRTSIWTSANFLDRFWSKVERRAQDECWPWMAGADRGRGRIWIDGKMEVSPRIAKVLADKRWPSPEMLACHTCDNPKCCNPDHIWWGTVGDNTRDASAKGRLRGPSQHTHCKNGHALTDENRLSGANRGCRICTRERFADWQRKARTARRATPNPLSHAEAKQPALSRTVADPLPGDSPPTSSTGAE